MNGRRGRHTIDGRDEATAKPTASCRTAFSRRGLARCGENRHQWQRVRQPGTNAPRLQPRQSRLPNPYDSPRYAVVGRGEATAKPTPPCRTPSSRRGLALCGENHHQRQRVRQPGRKAARFQQRLSRLPNPYDSSRYAVVASAAMPGPVPAAWVAPLPAEWRERRSPVALCPSFPAKRRETA